MDVKTLCLGALTFGDMAGYDIKKYFEGSFSHFFAAGYGSIYPALAELAEAGLVTCTDVAQRKRPDKKVYRITAAGHAALVDALTATYPHHKVRSEFLVLMYFAHLLPPERLVWVLDQRLEEWEGLLETLRSHDPDCCPTAGIRFSLGYGLAVIGAAVDYLRMHRAELTENLRTGGPVRSRRA